MRINKFIASNSEYSRRKADELIASGAVSVNGKVTKEMGLQLDLAKDNVTINNKAIKVDNNLVYLALHKPAGYISSRSDELGRKTIMVFAPPIPNLKAVGRLDLESEGLILLSNDGDFINRFTHPKYECEKEYLVKISGALSNDEKAKLEEGVVIDNKKTSPAKIRVIKRKENETTVKIVIHEGRNRQVRKMFAKIEHPVKYLKRLRIGSIKLSSLKAGSVRKLTNKEINDY